MSAPLEADAAQPGEYQVPGGLLGKLMAAVRLLFRADVLIFDAADRCSAVLPAWWVAAAVWPIARACAWVMKDAGAARTAAVAGIRRDDGGPVRPLHPAAMSGARLRIRSRGHELV